MVMMMTMHSISSKMEKTMIVVVVVKMTFSTPMCHRAISMH